MNSVANNEARDTATDDIVVLGVASMETRGGEGAGEMNGLSVTAGISEE